MTPRVARFGACIFKSSDRRSGYAGAWYSDMFFVSQGFGRGSLQAMNRQTRCAGLQSAKAQGLAAV